MGGPRGRGRGLQNSPAKARPGRRLVVARRILLTMEFPCAAEISLQGMLSTQVFPQHPESGLSLTASQWHGSKGRLDVDPLTCH